MTAFNLVRFRVKPGRDEAFIDAHRRANTDLTGARGFRRASLLKTGERSSTASAPILRTWATAWA